MHLRTKKYTLDILYKSVKRDSFKIGSTEPSPAQEYGLQAGEGSVGPPI